MKLEDLSEDPDYIHLLDRLKKAFEDCNHNNEYVILDGILLTTHNLFINTLIARAANQVFGYKPVFYAEKKSFFLEKLADSIQAEVWYKADVWESFSRWKRIQFKWKYHFKTKIFQNKILQARMGKIVLGDLIYDSIVRFEKKCFSSTFFKKDIVKSYFYRAVKEFFILDNLFKSKNIGLTTFSHKFYVDFGLMSRMSIENGVPYISKSRAHLNHVDSLSEILTNNYYINEKIKSRILRIDLKLAEKYMEDRFNGRFMQNDVKYAFASKSDMAENELLDSLGFKKKQAIGLIAGHAFSDAPHSDRNMIYSDYYIWFFKTLEIIQKIPHVNWIIKPHPAAEIFSEDGVVEEIFEKSDHVSLCPPDVKTDSVLKISDAVITVRGTIGLECQLFDAATILAGDSYYMDLGFSKNCANENDYIKVLSGIKFKGKVSETTKDLVKKVIYWKNSSYLFSSDLFGPEMVPNTSGQNLINHERENIKNLSDFLRENEYDDDLYYTQLINFLRNRRKTLCALDYIHQIE